MASPPAPQANPPAEQPTLRSVHERLSLPLALRLPLSMAVGSVSGFALGAAKGSQERGLRFRAENAHRQPRSQTGWFLYHKSKNYHMALGGVVEGLRQAARYSAWVGLYFVLEEGVDRGRAAAVRSVRGLRAGVARKRGVAARGSERGLGLGLDDEEAEEEDEVVSGALAGSRDCVSSMLAGLGTAGLFSAWNRFPVATAARTAKMGAKAGLAFGLLQDVLSLARGRRVGYVEFVKRHTVGSGDDVEVRSAAAA